MRTAIHHTNSEDGRNRDLAINGESVVCDVSGVIYLPDERALVVSDLHLEKGAAFARRRMLVPPYDTAATLSRLATAAARFDPRIVVSLGDSFHDREGEAGLPSVFRDALLSLMSGKHWFWIRGNHDPMPPVGLPGEFVAGCVLGRLVLRHEPSPGKAPGEIAGHLHPAARVIVRGHAVRRACFIEDGTRMIMPAFGAYTGSMDIMTSPMARHFERGRLMAHFLGKDRLYSFPAAALAG